MRRLAMIMMLAGLYAGAAFALDDTVTVKLEAQNNSGESGTATLMPEGDKTKVVILLSGAPAGVAQPAPGWIQETWGGPACPRAQQRSADDFVEAVEHRGIHRHVELAREVRAGSGDER